VTRKARCSLAAALVCGLAALAFIASRTISGVRSALIPPRPDLSSWPDPFADALGQAEKLTNDNPAKGLERLGELYRVNGFYDEAIACFHRLMDLQPGEPRWPHVLAGILADFGRLDEALPLEARAARLAPGNFVCRLRLGDMEFKRDHRDRAAAAYAATLELDAHNPYALLGLARCDIAAGRWNEARRHLLQSVQHQPRFPGVWDLLATVHEHFGENERAEAARRAAAVVGRYRDLPDPWLESAPGDCFDAYQLSVSAALLSDKIAARLRLQRAIELAPHNSAYRRQLAKLLMKDHDYAAARRHLQIAVDANPDDAESWATLVEVLLASHDKDAAYAVLARGLARCPQSAYLHFANGMRLVELQRLDEAAGEFRNAIKLQPNEARAHVQLSAIYVQRSRIEDALREIEAAAVAEPGNAGTLVLLARLAIPLDREAEARRAIAQLRRSPQSFQNDLAALEALYRKQFGRDPR
jgi:predicted Zn-dependent protease